jgi:hypothetical protein
MIEIDLIRFCVLIGGYFISGQSVDHGLRIEYYLIIYEVAIVERAVHEKKIRMKTETSVM